MVCGSSAEQRPTLCRRTANQLSIVPGTQPLIFGTPARLCAAFLPACLLGWLVHQGCRDRSGEARGACVSVCVSSWVGASGEHERGQECREELLRPVQEGNGGSGGCLQRRWGTETPHPQARRCVLTPFHGYIQLYIFIYFFQPGFGLIYRSRSHSLGQGYIVICCSKQVMYLSARSVNGGVGAYLEEMFA